MTEQRTVNIAEQLAREIATASEIRARFLDAGPSCALAAELIRAAVDRACCAMGSGEAVEILSALVILQEFTR